LLLVSCTPPGQEGVGGIFLQDLCVAYPAGQISAFLPLVDPQSYAPPSSLVDRLSLNLDTMGQVRLPPARWGTPGKALAWLSHESAFKRHMADLAGRAVAFGRVHRSDKVWAVLDAPASVALAVPVARALSVPLCSLVWDDARHVASAFGLDRLSARRFLAQFDDSVRCSERCAVISEPMADLYRQRYGVPCTIVRHGLDAAGQLAADSEEPQGDVFRIGYAGTLNAPCAFAALVRALESVNWRIGGRAIELVVTGPRLDVRTQRPARVRYYGWLSTVAETVELLAQVDVAYLPQPFTPDRADLARYSFPSKLATYLAAARPLLLHTPGYATLASYQREHALGAWCDSLEPQAIVEALRPLVTDPQAYAIACSQARAAFERDFTAERFRASFAEFIGADPAHVFDEAA
jgi:hypothetical protein